MGGIFSKFLDDRCTLLVRHAPIDNQRLDTVETEDLKTYERSIW